MSYIGVYLTPTQRSSSSVAKGIPLTSEIQTKTTVALKLSENQVTSAKTSATKKADLKAPETKATFTPKKVERMSAPWKVFKEVDGEIPWPEQGKEDTFDFIVKREKRERDVYGQDSEHREAASDCQGWGISGCTWLRHRDCSVRFEESNLTISGSSGPGSADKSRGQTIPALKRY